MLTKERKAELIRLSMISNDTDGLTAEELEFMGADWTSLPEDDAYIFLAVFAEFPETVERAALTAECTAQELQTACNVLKKIKAGTHGDWDNIDGNTLILTLQWAAERRQA